MFYLQNMQYNITNASKVAHRHAPINTLQTISVSVYRLVTGCATKIYITFPDSTSVIAQVDGTFAYLGYNVSVIRKFNISTVGACPALDLQLMGDH